MVLLLAVMTLPARSAVGGEVPAAMPSDPEALIYQPYGEAVLRTLDKITGRTATLTLPVGQPGHFGTLEILVHACRKTPPEERPEAAAFLDITDIPPSAKTPKQVFSGWMFASSPALSALQHPIYDVWVIGCRTVESDSASDGE